MSAHVRLVVPESKPASAENRRTALLITRDPKLTKSVTRVLRASYIDIVASADPESAPEWLSRGVDLVVFDDELAKETGSHWLTEMNQLAGRTPVILLSGCSDVHELADLLEASSTQNVVAKLGEIDNGDLLVTVRKLLEDDYFGIEKHLRWGSMLHTYTLDSNDARDGILKKFETFLMELKCRRVVQGRMLTVADEFMTNALYNAPVNAAGAHLYAAQSRTLPVQLSERQSAQVQFGSDGRYLAIGCRDPFGSIQIPKLRKTLVRCLRQGEDQISQKKGGAGIGLYLTFQFVTHLVVNVDPGRSTEFIGVVDMSNTARELQRSPHSLNFFVRPTPQGPS